MGEGHAGERVRIGVKGWREMRENLVSVIMAVYNDENRVQKAIESVKNQTFQKWELLCIDDGSTDGTTSILVSNSLEDERIKALYLKNNVGLGRARNIGIENASGRYVCFLDSDDYLKEDSLSILYEVAEETKCDEVYFGIENIFEDSVQKTAPAKNCYFGEHTLYSCYKDGAQFLYDMIENRMLSFAGCRQMFLKEFLDQNAIRFLEDIQNEDVPFTVDVIMKCSKLCYLRKDLYVYCHRSGSITTRSIDAYKLYSTFRISMILFDMWYMNKEKYGLSKWVLSYLYKQNIAYSKNLWLRLSQNEREKAKIKISGNAREAGLYCLFIEEQLEGMFVRRIEEEYLNVICKYKQIIIYGAGNYAVDIYMLLKKYSIDIKGFAVTKCSDEEARIDEKPVLAIEDWQDYREDTLIIIGTAKSSEKAIRTHLSELKFPNVLSL